MMIGWEPDGCGWGGCSRGRVQPLRRPCHPRSGAKCAVTCACVIINTAQLHYSSMNVASSHSNLVLKTLTMSQ